ncbi:MAG TPA: YIP1 family protein [Longimicrobiales bacterium]|nr:YIP1 family protein [Longimicrobiales bacterium]
MSGDVGVGPEAEAVQGAAAGGAGEPGRSLAGRLLDTVVSPGRMVREVAERPRWIGALLVAAALVALSTALIPPELFAEMQRRYALERGMPEPTFAEGTLTLIRVFSVLGGMVGFLVVSFLFAGVYTFVFAFVLGDEATYKQYLAVSAHASFIPALASLFLVPLRIQAGDPQLTLNLGSLLFFLDGGYLYSALRFLDLTQIWASLVTAAGAHAIDRRRSFASAAAILVGILLVSALVVGRFAPAAP